MKFEDLEAAWATQSSPERRAMDPKSLMRAVRPELWRRSRMLGYQTFVLLLGLVIIPALAVANYRYATPRDVTWHWVHTACLVTLQIILLVYTLRRVRRHRALLRQQAETLYTVTAVALANVEAEMQDLRFSPWSGLCLAAFVALPLVNVYLRFPVAEYGWMSFGWRAGFILGFTATIAFVFWRHYQTNLKPERARQEETLRQLS